MKRIMSLLIVLSVVALAAPPAMAAECWTCRFSWATCYPASASSTQRWTQCWSEDGVCELSGSPCPPALAASTPLSVDYLVASVERVDEPQQQQKGETAVAALELQVKR
ncbi:MAG TPA: hypothetical protein VF883_22770 [Thermoanaerobaculia bacterium]|jgi:hypothetical protein